MHVQNFSDIETEFIRRAHTMVWCSVATVDGKGRPRSRVLHPIWEGSTGWIGTFRDSFKAKHLAHNPHVSLAYVADPFRPAYIEAVAEWMDDLSEKERVWNLYKAAPEPLGYDPALIFERFDHPNFGLLKLTPWRIDLTNFPAPSYEEGTQVWRNPAMAGLEG